MLINGWFTLLDYGGHVLPMQEEDIIKLSIAHSMVSLTVVGGPADFLLFARFPGGRLETCPTCPAGLTAQPSHFNVVVSTGEQMALAHCFSL